MFPISTFPLSSQCLNALSSTLPSLIPPPLELPLLGLLSSPPPPLPLPLPLPPSPLLPPHYHSLCVFVSSPFNISYEVKPQIHCYFICALNLHFWTPWMIFFLFCFHSIFFLYNWYYFSLLPLWCIFFIFVFFFNHHFITFLLYIYFFVIWPSYFLLSYFLVYFFTVALLKKTFSFF